MDMRRTFNDMSMGCVRAVRGEMVRCPCVCVDLRPCSVVDFLESQTGVSGIDIQERTGVSLRDIASWEKVWCHEEWYRRPTH
jgi:hypothetical protein